MEWRDLSGDVRRGNFVFGSDGNFSDRLKKSNERKIKIHKLEDQ
jgi:hypothetical protein